MEMWMWISAGIVWLLLGLKACSWEKRCSNSLTLMLVALIMGPIGLMLVCSTADGEPMFVGRKNSIYWDEKQQQIKTKGGKCVYDSGETSRIKVLESQLSGLQNRTRKLEDVLPDEDWRKKCNDAISSNEKVTREFETRYQAQLQCGAKGHGKWVYAGGTKQKWDKTEHDISRNETITMKVMSYTAIGSDGFIFKCSDCGLEITKTAKELTATEREALKKLKLL